MIEAVTPYKPKRRLGANPIVLWLKLDRGGGVVPILEPDSAMGGMSLQVYKQGANIIGVFYPNTMAQARVTFWVKKYLEVDYV